MAQPCVIGVDLGGTNVRACAYYEDGTEAGPKFSVPSRAQEGIDALVEAVGKTIRQAVESAQDRPIAVGLAIPGHIDDTAGLVVWAPNFGQEVDGVFQSWRNVPLRQLLAPYVGLPIHTGNDANLAALGEYRFGSGKNRARCLVMVTLGTGVGGGVVLSPAAVHGEAKGPLLLLGGNKGGAELGHICLDPGGPDCHAGTYGALEAYCQRDAIVVRAIHRLRRGRVSLVRELVGDNLSLVTPQLLAQAADQGDELALEVWREVGTYLGVALGNFINIFAPDVLAIGGQIAKAGAPLLEPARQAAQNVAIPSLFTEANIVHAEQVDDAGMLGGAALALEALRWNQTMN